jgi:hypothetical protein
MSVKSRALTTLTAVLVVVLVATDLSAARMVGALVICLLLPGLGWARKMHFSDFGDTLALAIVLSICMTVAVGTTMALSRSWSLGWGLASLAGLALAGFIPARLLLDRAGADRDSRQQAKSRQARAAANATDASAVWVDWYAEVERRADEARAREAAAKQAAIDQWISWYQQTHLLTKRSDRRSE